MIQNEGDESKYLNCRFLFPTSNILGRFFSAAGDRLSDLRQNIATKHSEQQLFLRANMGQFAETQFAEFGKLSLPCPVYRKKIRQFVSRIRQIGFRQTGLWQTWHIPVGRTESTGPLKRSILFFLIDNASYWFFTRLIFVFIFRCFI